MPEVQILFYFIMYRKTTFQQFYTIFLDTIPTQNEKQTMYTAPTYEKQLFQTLHAKLEKE